MDKGAWWAMVRGVAWSQTRLKRLSTHTQRIMVFVVLAIINLVVYNLIPSVKNEEDFQ